MKKKRKKRNSGIIIGFLNFISTLIVKGISGGFIGKIFTSYNRVERHAKKGIIFGAMSRAPGGQKKSIRRKLMKWFDESLGIKLLRRAMNFLKSSRLNFYGTYFATFGLYSLMVVLLKSALQSEGVAFAETFVGVDFWSAVIIFLASIPLLSSTKSLLTLASSSLSLRMLLEDCAGLSDNKFEEECPVKNKHSYFAAILSGILTGGLAYFVSPLKIVSIIGFACLICLFLNFPEMGVICTIFATPFLGFLNYPSTVLIIMVGITAISYFIKVAVGRRTLTVRLVDVFVLLFAILLLAGGIVTSGGQKSLGAAVMYTGLIIMYFLIVNLVNTKEWLDRCTAVVAIPSVIIAAVGVLGYMSGTMPSKWLDTDMFSDITNRAVSSFDNPNMLATYLILTTPFVWIYIKRKGVSLSGKIIALLGAFITLLCTVLTWSRGGWLGIIAALVIFWIINYKYTFKYFLVGGLLSPIWVRLVPDNVMGRFTSIGNLADSSTYYRLYTWKGSLKMFFDNYPGGIGIGESAFAQIYPLYSYMGTESTMHSHNLFLEIAVELGIMGIVLFAIIIFMIFQRGFGCIKYNTNDKLTIISVSAALSGLIAALVHGMFDYIWYNYRVFFMFWVVAAILCAYANVYPKKTSNDVFERDVDKEASLDIIFGDVG